MSKAPESYNFGRHPIKLITGPMFSGKTQELLGKLSRHEAIGHKVLLICSKKDNRGDSGEAVQVGATTTHRKNPSSLSNATEISTLKLGDIPQSVIINHDAIGIDEGQFFPDLELAITWALNCKKILYVAGLLSTSEGTLFGKMANLLPFSKHIQLEAVCELCYKRHDGVFVNALMTQCIVEKSEDEMIGTNQYIPVCLRHWHPGKILNSETLTPLRD
jgi:thymidine kinase